MPTSIWAFLPRPFSRSAKGTDRPYLEFWILIFSYLVCRSRMPLKIWWKLQPSLRNMHRTFPSTPKFLRSFSVSPHPTSPDRSNNGSSFCCERLQCISGLFFLQIQSRSVNSSVSDSSCSSQCLWNLSLWLHISLVYSFLLLSQCPLYRWTTIGLFICR